MQAKKFAFYIKLAQQLSLVTRIRGETVCESTMAQTVKGLHGEQGITGSSPARARLASFVLAVLADYKREQIDDGQSSVRISETRTSRLEIHFTCVSFCAIRVPT